MVHFEAKRLGLRGLSKEEISNKKEIVKKSYLLLPILVIIVVLMKANSAEVSAIIGIVSVIIVGAIRKETRMSFADILEALATGARMSLGVVAATACAGIIVGTITLTGIGLKLANGLIDLAGGGLLLTLFFTMAPYIFVLSPELLLIDTTWNDSVWVMFTSIIGMIGVGAGMIGYWLCPMNP